MTCSKWMVGVGLALVLTALAFVLQRGNGGAGPAAAQPELAAGGPGREAVDVQGASGGRVAQGAEQKVEELVPGESTAEAVAGLVGWPESWLQPGTVEIVPVLPNRGRVGWERWLVFVPVEGRPELAEAGVGELLAVAGARRSEGWQRLGPARIASPQRDVTIVVMDGSRAGAVHVPAGSIGRLEVELRYEASVVLRAVDEHGNGIPGLSLMASFGEDGREGTTDAQGLLELGLDGLVREGPGLTVRRQLLGSAAREWHIAPDTWRGGEVTLTMDDVGAYVVGLVNTEGLSVGGQAWIGLLPAGVEPGDGPDRLLENVRSELELGPRLVGQGSRLLVAHSVAGLDLVARDVETWAPAQELPPPGSVARPAELQLLRFRNGLRLTGRLRGIEGPGRVTWVIERQQSGDAMERISGSARRVLTHQGIEDDGSFVVQIELRGNAPVVAVRGFGEVAGPIGRFRVSVEFAAYGADRLEPFGERDLGPLQATPIGLLAEGVVEDLKGLPQSGLAVIVVDLDELDLSAQRAHGIAEHREWLPARTDERGRFEIWGITGARRPALQIEDQPLFSSWARFIGLPAPVPFLAGDQGLRLVLE